MGFGNRHFARENERRTREAVKEALAEKLRLAHEFIAARLGQIADNFSEPVKITLVVRNPAHPDGSRDVCLGDDDFDLAIAAGRRVLATGKKVKP